MNDELLELFDIAMYKEMAAQAFYLAAKEKTQDAGAQQLLKELADKEMEHSRWLRELKVHGVKADSWHKEKLPDLMLSDYLIDVDISEKAGLQDVLTFAIKREEQAAIFYSNMLGMMEYKPVRRLCEQLVHEELIHKINLENLYDALFYKEN